MDVRPHERGLTEAIIEECMLLANQCAANLARTRHLPFVYRVHEKPDAEHKERLFGVLKACGIEPAFAGDTPTPKELSAILDSVRGQPLERAVHIGILRGMEKAKYDPQPKGHFGLALADYAHFTSPIRRYPDLAIHRILSAWLEGESPELLTKLYEDFAQQVSQQASSQVVKADVALVRGSAKRTPSTSTGWPWQRWLACTRPSTVLGSCTYRPWAVTPLMTPSNTSPRWPRIYSAL